MLRYEMKIIIFARLLTDLNPLIFQVKLEHDFRVENTKHIEKTVCGRKRVRIKRTEKDG